MKYYIKEDFEFHSGSSALWLILCALLVPLAIFFVRQMIYVPIDTVVVKDFVIDEGKEKASPIKKYFPKPYSVNDLARGDYDRH